ncbi:hypothetical protein Cgig2_022811 [Carnegiea gigantea]|uniref:Pentatricopeptide repeat-containing protein n=1 Tax=Carnegiea gigantea TaxID=171969 RepID=A0A9Q1KPL2_9CARY|nr:hypothetical protein Cgig2_022811 [Carnegiea gigantea]
MASLLKLFRSGTAAWRGMSTAAVKKEKDGTVLFRRLVALGLGNSDAKVADVLDEWVREGHEICRSQVIAFGSQLRRFNKPHIALQLYQWMEENKRALKNSDCAFRIDLLFKTEGIASAEKYFNDLSESARTKKTYGALLYCYCQGKMLEEATQLFQKMAELNFHATALNYNNMMALYVKIGQPEKVPLLFQEMKEKNIAPDLYTYNQLMNSYAALKDIDAVEGVLQRMESKKITYDWFTLGNLATIYFNAGLKDKAKAALEELERLKLPKNPEAFHTLIHLYSHLSDAAGVSRAWELCKSKFTKPSNTSYLIMHLALSRLGDYDGLENLFKEWESSCSIYDSRIPNVLLESYLKRGMIEEASLLYESVTRRGVDPNLRMHNSYMNLCLKKRQIDLALQTLEACVCKIISERHSWFPPQESVNAFFKYFAEEKDAVTVSKFREIMKTINRLDAETEKILDAVCLP